MPLAPAPISVVAWPTVFQHAELKVAIGLGLQPRKAELVLRPRKAELVPIGVRQTPVSHAA